MVPYHRLIKPPKSAAEPNRSCFVRGEIQQRVRGVSACVCACQSELMLLRLYRGGNKSFHFIIAALPALHVPIATIVCLFDRVSASVARERVSVLALCGVALKICSSIGTKSK